MDGELEVSHGDPESWSGNSFTAVWSVATLWIHLIGGGGRIGQNNPEDVHSGQEGKEWCVCGDLGRVEVNGPWLFLDNIK